MRFAIIGSRKSPNTTDLIEAITRSGNEPITVLLTEIGVLCKDHTTDILWKDASLIKETDIFLFRGFEKNFRLARVIARTAIRSGKTVIDDTIATKEIANKVSQAEIFATHSIPHPKTLFTSNRGIFISALGYLGLPLVAKPIDGARGEDIFLLRTENEALDFFDRHQKTHLFQEYLPMKSDLRVFITGDNVLGAIRRYVIDGDIRSNASLGAESEAVTLTDEIASLAKKAASVVGYEIAGVDLAETPSGYSVLEVNHTPQWQAFKASTGINPAEHIVRYALEKNSKTPPQK